MERLAVIAVSALVASCLSTAQVQTPNATVQAGSIISNDRSQTDNGTGEIPTFHSHARQVLVTVSVRKHSAKSAAWVPEEVLKQYPTAAAKLATPPITRGLSANDFHIFDNGVEQKINYLQESDSSGRETNEHWFFSAHVRGTWGAFTPSDLALVLPAAIYVIGYIPPASQSSDCHTIRVVAEDNDVMLNRTRYCNTEESETATVEETKLAEQADLFDKSGKSGSIKVSSRPFVFWSSRVLSLLRDKPETGVGSASTAANYTYVISVHDSRAPATVQIATEYELGMEEWHYPCPSEHLAIYVFGVIHKATGEVAGRFGDSYRCSTEDYAAMGAESITIPTRFNTQVELRPGDYDVHVVVSDGNKFGQARIPLRVERLDSQALTISDLAVNGILRDASWLLQDAALVSPAPLVPAPLVSKHAQFIPVPDSRIQKKSSLPLYFDIYEPLLADRGRRFISG